MKQIIQNLKSGETILEEIPAPHIKDGQLLIQTTRSLVSLGTERMLVEFGKANLIQKTRQQPDKVKMVLNKIKSDGLLPTLETVFKKLNQPLPLGYCNVGKVVGVGKNTSGFKIGDRVASNGAHAEFVCVPQNLVAHIPDEVDDDSAAFTVIGAIGLQGIRLLKPTLGETIVVVGLGLIGLITAELLLANGCQVIGIDLDENKIKIAQEKGIICINPKKGIDPVKAVNDYTKSVGADGVIITASTKSNEVISQAAQMSRKRGRIILIGVIGLELNRSEFYEKELTFQVSCSYGPGRYDSNYEQDGNDYPLAFVRWTEKRNFEVILNKLKNGQLNVKPLISEIVDLNNYNSIYNNMSNSKSIASILKYAADTLPNQTVLLKNNAIKKGEVGIGIIGAGNFTKMTMLPLLKNAELRSIASAGGLNGTTLAKQYKINKSTSDYKELINDESVDLVLITTRHNLHAFMTIDTLKAGKDVFVEKPLALNLKHLKHIVKTYNNTDASVTVGYNRRFSPHSIKVNSFLDKKQSKNIICTMNAGFIPAESWVHDMNVGGGRIIGEACHHMDLAAYFSGSLISQVCMMAQGQHPEVNTDNAVILLKFENGDVATINYFSNGHKAYSKERVEVYQANKTFIIDNFRETKGYGQKGFSRLKTKLDKGHKKQFDELINRRKIGGSPLIPFDQIVNASLASFAAIQSLEENRWVSINELSLV